MKFVKILNLPTTSTANNNDYLVVAREGVGAGTFKTPLASILNSFQLQNSDTINLYYNSSIPAISAELVFVKTLNTPSINLSYDTVLKALTASLNGINTVNTPTISLRYDTTLNALSAALVPPITIPQGGTGLTIPPNVGTLLIGNGTGYNLVNYRDGLKVVGNFFQVALEPGGGLDFNALGQLKIADKVTFIDTSTDINIFFASSIGADLTYLQTGVTNILYPRLLPFYNNNSTLLNTKVKVINKTDNLFWQWASTQPAVGSSKVINIIIENDAGSLDTTTTNPQSYYPGVPYPFNPQTTPSLNHSTDVNNFRTFLNSQPNNYRAVIIQTKLGYGVETQNSSSNGPKFRDYLYSTLNNLGVYTGTKGLLDKDSQIGVVYDVDPRTSAATFSDTIYKALVLF